MAVRRYAGRRVLRTLSALFLAFTLSACVKDDWAFSDLPNDYEIWSLNTGDVTLVKRDGDIYHRQVDGFVEEYCFNDTYIGLKCHSSGENISQDFDYYMVDAEKNLISGPYSLEEYKALLEEKKAHNMSEWVKTR